MVSFLSSIAASCPPQWLPIAATRWGQTIGMGQGIRSYLTPRFEGVVWRTVTMSSACSFPRCGEEHGRATEVQATREPTATMTREPRQTRRRSPRSSWWCRGWRPSWGTRDSREGRRCRGRRWAAYWLRHSKLMRGAAASGEKMIQGLVWDGDGHQTGLKRKWKFHFNGKESCVLLSHTIRQLYS
jgi:hypothetical protein